MIEVLSAVRSGRFVRSERLENDGRIQSWVLAGVRGAVEMRGTGPDRLYCVVHNPSTPPGVGHGYLTLIDADAFPRNHCTVLETPCWAVLLASPLEKPPALDDPWQYLEDVYRLHLEEP